MNIYKINYLCQRRLCFCRCLSVCQPTNSRCYDGILKSPENVDNGRRNRWLRFSDVPDYKGINPNLWRRPERSVLFNCGWLHQGAVEKLWPHVELDLKQMYKREQLKAQSRPGHADVLPALRRLATGTRLQMEHFSVYWANLGLHHVRVQHRNHITVHPHDRRLY